jgi:23S rRNA pseudouridine1911/1915/1917 synthase
MLIARHADALSALQAQFKARTIRKTYLALCVGCLMLNQGIIDQPIGRHPTKRQQMAVLASGRPAVTRYLVKERLSAPDGSRYTLVRAHPLTGRTHQLRVHFAALGYPIVGDALYGSRRDPLTRVLKPRQMLHASELAFVSPATGQEVKVHAPLPDDMRNVLATLLTSPSACDQ